MRWLLIVFLVSVVALLFAASGLAYHIFRQRSRQEADLPTGFEPVDESDATAKR